MSEYVAGLVSVVMPTYKRSEMLSRAIESVLTQTYTNLELLLVNDNEPTDDFTKELVERVKVFEKDSRFRLVMQEKHINGAAARNVGIRLACGEYVAFLDDDDWWEPNKIEKQINCLCSLPNEWGGVSCKYSFVNREGDVIGRSSAYKDGHIYLDILNLITDVTTCSLLLRHTALDDAGHFDENLLRHQDFQLLVCFTNRFKLKLVDEYLLNIDVSDTQNRPDAKKLIEHKKRFFASIEPIFSRLSKSDRKCVYCMHCYELGYVFLKNKDFKNGIKYVFKIFTSLKAFRLAFKKTYRKLNEMSKR